MTNKKFEFIFFFSAKIFVKFTSHKACILLRDFCGLGSCYFIYFFGIFLGFLLVQCISKVEIFLCTVIFQDI